VDRFGHAGYHRAKQLLGLFWIPIDQQLERTGQVSEENRYLLSLALLGTTRDQNALGQLRWNRC
jgi:hypothetical protein